MFVFVSLLFSCRPHTFGRANTNTVEKKKQRQINAAHTSAVLEHVPELGRVGRVSAQSAGQTDNGQGNVGRGRHLEQRVGLGSRRTANIKRDLVVNLGVKSVWMSCVVELSVDGTNRGASDVLCATKEDDKKADLYEAEAVPRNAEGMLHKNIGDSTVNSRFGSRWTMKLYL